MKTLKYEYIASGEIITPFQIKSLPIHISDSLIETLGILFPKKADYFKTRHPQCLIVSKEHEGPFGPDPEVLQKYLLPDLKEGIKLIQKKYHIKDIVLTGNTSLQSTENNSQLAAGEGELIKRGAAPFFAGYSPLAGYEII